MRAVQVAVHGRVQGVFYRRSAQEEARRLGLAGWVKNRGDGAVALRVQGDPDAVDHLLAWCRSGPPGAEVTALDVEEAGVDGSLSGFEVR